MAAPTTARGTKLLIKVGDGEDPEVFSHPCTISGQRAIVFTSTVNEVNVPDCALPDQLAWIEREKVSVSAAINGEGTLNAPDADLFFEWVTDEDEKNVKCVIDIPGSTGGRIYSGAFHCTQFEEGGNRGEKVNASIQLQSTGVVTKTNNAG